MSKPEDNDLGPGTLKASADWVSANEVRVTIEHTGSMERCWKQHFVADGEVQLQAAILHWLISLPAFEDTQVFTASDSAEAISEALVGQLNATKIY